MEPKKLTLVRIVAPHFVAGLETDGVVRRAAPILNYMVGWPDDRVRAYVKEQAWKTSVVAEPSIKHHSADFGGSNAGSFEVRYAGGRKFFYYDDNARRRAIGRHMTKEQALAAAQAFLADL
jgi:hypothetical protein